MKNLLYLSLFLSILLVSCEPFSHKKYVINSMVLDPPHNVEYRCYTDKINQHAYYNFIESANFLCLGDTVIFDDNMRIIKIISGDYK